MLELPESNTIASQINQHLTGKTVSYIEVLKSPHKFAFFKGDIQTYPDQLEGKTIVGATSHGGMIEIDFEDNMIVFADGAYPRYYDKKEKFPKKHQLALYFDDDTAIFVSIQMYGEIFIYPTGTCMEDYYISSCEKPNPLSEKFTFEYFSSLYHSIDKKISAKAFLATKQRIPGLGNGVLQDILWDAGIDPRYEVKEEDLRTLYDSVRRVLGKMVEEKGRDTEKNLLGEYGGYITQLSKKSVYQPCMKCGNEIHKASYMGGTVYFCEHCQKR